MEDRNRRKNENMRNEDRHLFRLNELDDYKVASDDPDVRGWEIIDRDRDMFGTVRELIVDPDQERVRYLDVEPKGNNASRTENERLLIPIGAARLDEDNHKVIVNDIDRKVLGSYPRYTGTAVDREYETAVVERFNRPSATAAGTPGADEFYNQGIYDETRFYTNRNRNV